jgi:predicted MFS family arabinose efflux permease
MASQALLVVLAPTIVAIAGDLEASVGAVGQARSLTAGVAIAASLAIAGRIDAVGVPRLLRIGAGLAIVACAAVAASPTLPVFVAVHGLVGLALACLVSAGFAGVGAFPRDRRAWAMGYVAGANALAWIVVNPIVGTVAESVSWRAAQIVPATIALAALLAALPLTRARAAPTAPGLGTLLAEASARRWLGAEVIAYGAWTALLTFVGAFFIQRHGVGEAGAGWILAAGAAAYFAAATQSGALLGSVRRRHVVAGSALIMGGLLPLQLAASGSVPVAAAIFCLIGMVAGVRSPASSGLGLEQIPQSPGAMMAARTAATQLGYLMGAVIGGAVIAGPGYGALGGVLAVGMVVSAVLVMRVHDPLDRLRAAGGG